mgnify:CR=1 FL=1
MEDKKYLEKSYANDKEINEDILQFVYATNRYIYHLVESKDHEGWEQRLEHKRKDVMRLLRKAQDLLYACMHEGKESVPYRIGNLITLLWRMLKVSNEDDEIYKIATHLIIHYKDAPLMDELKDIDIYDED